MHRRPKRLLALFAALTLLALAAGCESRQPTQQVGAQPAEATPTPAPGAAPAAAAAAPAAAAADGNSVSGKVLETMNSGGYTYARIERIDGTTAWLAGPETSVAVGDQVRAVSNMIMKDFESPTLGRTFSSIDFVSTLERVDGGGTPVPAAGGAHAAMAPADGGHQGRVVETMDGGNYTYVLIQPSAGEPVWAAGPKTTVAVGDAVRVPSGTTMRDFESPTLGRTFAAIEFVAAIEPVESMGEAAGVAAPAPAAPADAAAPVEKLADGQTVAEIVGGRTELAGKPVAVRGRVVKFNPGILGTNWIHLRDGSGDETAGTHDLTVTSPDATVSVGDIVEVRGQVAIDRDFGAGYTYPVLIENAEVKPASN